MKKIKNNKKGFTLIEMIVVIVIIAILVALAVPAVMGYVQDARDAKLEAAGHAGTVTMQAALAKDESKGTLDEARLKAIIGEGKTAAGAKTEDADPVLCKAEAKTSTCTSPYALTDSFDDIKSYIFTIDGHVVIVPSDGGDILVDPKAAN